MRRRQAAAVVDGLYDSDPATKPKAKFIEKISGPELREHNRATLPFDRALVDLLANTRRLRSFRIVNGLKPDVVRAASAGEDLEALVTAE